MLGGLSTGTKAQLGMGLLGVAIAAYEHYSKQGEAAPASPEPVPPASPYTQPIPNIAHRGSPVAAEAQAQRSAFPCDKVGMIIAGYEVPHTHIHLIPTTDMSQLNFANAAASIDRDELEATADLIRNQIAA